MRKHKPILDLFEFPHLLPVPVQDAINEAGEVDTYEQCEALKARLNALGYDIDYYLDATPYNLRKVKPVKQ